MIHLPISSTATSPTPTPPPTSPPIASSDPTAPPDAGRRSPRSSEYSTWTEADADGYGASYEGWSHLSRYYRARLRAITDQLAAAGGRDLLDVGCGPGMMLAHLRATWPDRFRLTGLDQSSAMVRAAQARLGSADDVHLVTAPAERMPLADSSFDVVLAMGVLEYTDLEPSLAEIGRVTRPGGLVVVTMLNPMSPYRLVDWGVYAPALRLLGRLEALAGVPESRRHGAPPTGIRARTPGSLRRALVRHGLRPVDVVHYDRTVLVPPLDRPVRRLERRPRHLGRLLGRGWPASLTGTAYLVAARRWGPPSA